MTIFGRLATTAALATLVVTGACATHPDSQHGVTDTAIGAPLGGYLLGDIVGGRRDRTARIRGSGVGGVPGTEIGAYMDRQEHDLRARTAGSDVRVTRQGDDLILTIPSGISFAYKSDSVAPGFDHLLEQIAGVLHAYGDSFVDVYGHTDATGSDAYNQRLSERCAASVATYLDAHGVTRARIATMGFGKMQPIASNETPEGQAANRRVEIKIVPIAEADLR